MTDKRKDEMIELARRCHHRAFEDRMQTWVNKIICSKALVEWNPKFQANLEHEITAIAQSAFDTAVNYVTAATRSYLSPPVPDAVTIPREVLQGVREALDKIASNDATAWYYKSTAQEALASLDAVLAKGE